MNSPIKFNKELKDLNAVSLELSVEKIIGEYATRRLPPTTQRGSFRDMQRGVLGLDTKRFEVKGEGVIEYRHYVRPGHYTAEVELQGFSQDSQVYTELIERLGALKTKSTEELKALVIDTL